VLAVQNEHVFCIDILASTSEETYISFFKTLNTERIEMLYIDPGETLRSAVDICFPEAKSVITGECIERYARNALLEVIKKDGKRFPITNKNDKLVLFEDHLQDAVTKKRMKEGFCSRPRLKLAYRKYQQLLRLLNQDWTYENLSIWVANLSNELPEFDDLRDIIELHKDEIQAFLNAENPPEKYPTAIAGVCKAIGEMPNCIFDVLRARCMLTVSHDVEERDGVLTRLGIETSRFAANLNEISVSIRKIKDPFSD